MAKAFRHEHHYRPKKGDRVRTITTPTGHRVRVAFPRGPRRKGSSKLVSILHPFGENPNGHECVDVHFAKAGPVDAIQNGVGFRVNPSGKTCLACGLPMSRRAKTDTCASCRSTHAGVMAEQRRRDVDWRSLQRLRARLKKNPAPTLIYPRVEKIFATKPDGQPYVHEMESGETEPPFTGSARAYGLANGDVLISTRVLDA